MLNKKIVSSKNRTLCHLIIIYYHVLLSSEMYEMESF